MDKKTVTTISYLSRLKIDGEKEEKIIKDLDNIIEFVDQLDDVDTSNIEPLTNPLEKTAKTRTDEVTAKNLKNELLEIAPSSNEDYFLVPRVVEWKLNIKQSKKLKAWFLKKRFQTRRLFKKFISLLMKIST